MAARILVSLMLIGMAVPMVPPAAADMGCPPGALACCTVGATCNVAGACSLGTTKVVHAHGTAGVAASITLNCAFDGLSLDVVSCTGTSECTTQASDGIGGNMRCTKASPGGSGYCAIFP